MAGMLVAIAGGHGQIALRLTRLLSERGDDVRSLIRNPDHADDVRDAGGDPVVCDLEEADDALVANAVRGADAVVFAAGAGPGSGPQRKGTMDLGGAVKLIAAAKAGGMKCIAVLSAEHHSEDRLRAAGADRVVGSLTEVTVAAVQEVLAC